jgi:hypothetical protein
MTTLTVLTPRHTRDNEEVVVTKLYITSDHALMICGHCSKCLMDVTIIIPLADLHDFAVAPLDYGVEDLAFLHSLGCSLPNTPLLAPPSST